MIVVFGKERCGWMCEGNVAQCVLEAGHEGELHEWEVFTGTFSDEENTSSDPARTQKMSPLPSNRGCEIQNEEKRGMK